MKNYYRNSCRFADLRSLLPLILIVLLGCQQHTGTGSDPAPNAGKTISNQMDYENRSREYVTHLPENYNADDSFPLIIALHGGFGKAENMEGYTGLSAKADEEDFVVVYPQGVLRSWNAGRCCGPAHKRGVDDVGFLSALIDSLAQSYSIDTNKVFATGLSNGRFMAYQMLCKKPGKVKAVAPVSASMVNKSCKPARSGSIIHFHSYQDEHVPYQGGQGVGPSDVYKPSLDSVFTAWSAINNCAVQHDTVKTTTALDLVEWRSCSQQTKLQLYLTKDGGHSWPGGTLNVPDQASDAVNATDKMWEFFERQ